MKNGRLWVNGVGVGLQADGMGFAEDETGAQQPVSRFTETLPGGRQHTIFKEQVFGMLDNMPEVTVPPNHLFVMATIATIPPTAECRSTPVVSDYCRSPIWSDEWTRWSAPGTWPPPKAGRSGTGRRTCGCRGFFTAVR